MAYIVVINTGEAAGNGFEALQLIPLQFNLDLLLIGIKID
jgi:hypothetical protein